MEFHSLRVSTRWWTTVTIYGWSLQRRFVTLSYCLGTCFLGALLVARSDRGLCAIFLGEEPAVLVDALRQRFRHALVEPDGRDMLGVVARVASFVEHPCQGLDLPLDVVGTPFQQRVWKALKAVPAGTTVSYADLADRIDRPGAGRAVAAACAANPLAVVIPCHRVIRSDGGMSGYRWGDQRKKALIEREARDAALSLSNP